MDVNLLMTVFFTISNGFSQLKTILLNYFLAVVFIIITLPLQIIIFILLLIELKEFPIFIQERGLTLTNGRFRMLKFKTIVSDRAKEHRNNKEFLLPFAEDQITLIANFLRKTGLDELPQLFHVISGKMNIVGPRPLMIKDLNIMKEKFSDYYDKRDSINLKPGLTGLWQLYGKKKEGIEDILKFDILYLEKRSVKFDISIIARTLIYVISCGKNSFANGY